MQHRRDPGGYVKHPERGPDFFYRNAKKPKDQQSVREDDCFDSNPRVHQHLLKSSINRTENILNKARKDREYQDQLRQRGGLTSLEADCIENIRPYTVIYKEMYNDKNSKSTKTVKPRKAVQTIDQMERSRSKLQNSSNQLSQSTEVQTNFQTHQVPAKAVDAIDEELSRDGGDVGYRDAAI